MWWNSHIKERNVTKNMNDGPTGQQMGKYMNVVYKSQNSGIAGEVNKVDMSTKGKK